MKLSKKDKRTAKKLVLPLIAIAMMTAMMFMESASRRSHQQPPAKTSSR
jgi:hypothetical protein